MARRATMLLALFVVASACSPRSRGPSADDGVDVPVWRDVAADGEAGANDERDAAPLVDAGSPGDAAADFDAAPPPVQHALEDAGPPACDPAAQYGAATLLAISATGLDEIPGSVTPDELTIAWTTAQGHVRYSDRASTSADFQVPAMLVGSYAVDRAALSPDGLRLAIVSVDGRSVLEASRASRSDPFAAPEEGTFAVIDADAATSLAPGETLGDVVLGADDRVLYYSRRGAGGAHTVLRAMRLFPGDPWQVGVPLAIPELEMQGAARRRPTGLSRDARTLFFWDEALAIERAGWFSPQGDSFERVVDLGDRRGATPNGACDRLYFGALGPVSSELFFADRN